MFFICMYFFRVPNWPKIGIFLGLGPSPTFGPPPPPHRYIFPGVPPLGFYARSAKPVTICACVCLRRKACEIFWTTYAPFKIQKLVVFRLQGVLRSKEQFHRSHKKVCTRTATLCRNQSREKSTPPFHFVSSSALSPDTIKLG